MARDVAPAADDTPARRRGTLTSWGERGFGFIRAPRVRGDIWVHIRDIAGLDASGTAPALGSRVEFDLVEEGARLAAERVRVLGPVDDATDAVVAILGKVDAEADELALATPARQRLVILAWVADARAEEARFPREPRLRRAVSDLSARLTGCCKAWWPGSVRTLMLNASPASALGDMPAPPPPRPDLRWADVAESAAEALEAVKATDEGAGRDEYGWADGWALRPGAPNADARLAALTEALRPLEAPDHPGPRPSPEQFRRWAMELRWVRGDVLDGGAWGAAMGRLRFWAEKRAEFAAHVHLMGEDCRPPASWAELLGLAPPVAPVVARDAVGEFLAAHALPPADEPDGRAEWLRLALPLAEAEGRDRILAALASARDWFDAVVPAVLLPESRDKPLRSRLRALQKRATASPAAVPPAPAMPPPAPPVERAPAEAEEARLPEADLQRVRAYTVGKHALFVGNRNDPGLHGRLERIFGLRLDWCEFKPARIKGVTDRVAGGRYALVLFATGFTSHAIERPVAEAAHAAGVDYASVNRGRPLAVLRALLRDVLRGARPVIS